jgi:hypothetical protein
MPLQRNRLPTLEVRVKSRCNARRLGGELATMLWDEVQKALTANAITETQRLVPLHLREFVREVDLAGHAMREWVVVSRIVRGSPFASLAPSALSTTGFVYEAGDTAVFAGPDAALMLSGEFVATHCFYAVEGAGPLAGLAFQPTSGRRVPDVSGTLWVDRESNELRYLNFSYTGLPGVLNRKELGGRVEFTRLPGGRWIISYWHIRMPRIETQSFELRHGAREVTDVKGYTDRGGRAEVAGDTLGLIHRAILTGRVYDSIAGKGLAGALVWVRGTRDTMPTDGAGRFEMALELTGDQTVSLRHPRVGLLGESTDRTVLLSLGDTTKVQFVVPSVATFVRAFCRNRPGRVSVVGVARKADGSIAADQEIVATKRTSGGNAPIAETGPVRTTRTGLFGLCNLPARDTLQVSMMYGKTTLVELPVPLLTDSRWVELREWGSTDSTSAGFVQLLGRTEPARERPDSGEPAVMVGRVYDSTTGRGVAGAVVRVHSYADSAVADGQGRFALRVAAAGWQIVGITHAGVGELRGTAARNVALSAGDTVAVEFPVIPVESVMGRLCGDRLRSAGVVGVATGSSARPEPGLLLRVTWVADGRRERQTRSGPGGLFAFCDLPADLTGGELLTLQVFDSTGVVGQISLQLHRAEHRWIEIGLPRQ